MGSEKRNPLKVERSGGEKIGRSGCCRRKWPMMCCPSNKKTPTVSTTTLTILRRGKKRERTHSACRVSHKPHLFSRLRPCLPLQEPSSRTVPNQPLYRLLNVERVRRPLDVLPVGAEAVVGDGEGVVLWKEVWDAGDGSVAGGGRPPGPPVDEDDETLALVRVGGQVEIELVSGVVARCQVGQIEVGLEGGHGCRRKPVESSCAL